MGFEHTPLGTVAAERRYLKTLGQPCSQVNTDEEKQSIVPSISSLGVVVFLVLTVVVEDVVFSTSNVDDAFVGATDTVLVVFEDAVVVVIDEAAVVLVGDAVVDVVDAVVVVVADAVVVVVDEVVDDAEALVDLCVVAGLDAVICFKRGSYIEGAIILVIYR